MNCSVFENRIISFLKSFLFCVAVQPIHNVVVVSGAQQRDSAVHIHVSILLQTPLPSRLSHSTEQSSMCYTVGPCWLGQDYFLLIFICETPFTSPHSLSICRITWNCVNLPLSRNVLYFQALTSFFKVLQTTIRIICVFV